MKLDVSSTALVIVGGWNIHIFTVEWVKRFLLPGENEDLKIEYAQSSPAIETQFISPRISSTDVRIILVGKRLFIEPVKDDDRILDHVQEVALQLADFLPHTPVIGYGVNFAFTEEDYTTELIESIRPNDSVDVQAFGVSITDEEYKRSLLLDGNVLNLTINIRPDSISLRFNFHSDIKSLGEFKSKISATPMRVSKEAAIAFMAEIYGLEIDT